MAYVVHTGFGRIGGRPEEGVLPFLGIPYAEPPIGPLRFRPPQKPVAWSGVREAFTYGPAAMQVGNPMAAQTGAVPSEVSEDCLSLNVWTPAADLLDLQRRVTPRTGGVFYRPVGAGDLIPTDAFHAVAAGASRGIPLLCGTNLDEMKFFRAMAPGVDTLDGAGLLTCCRTLRPGSGRAEHVIETYHAVRQARGAEISPPELWFAIAGDHAYRHPVMSQAERHAAHTPQTYAYLFAWCSPAREGRLGAAHTMEIPFVFGRLDDPGTGPLTGHGDAVQRLSAQMMDAWIAFARTGTPATAALPDWPAYTADLRATMVFDMSVSVVDAPLEAERAVWASAWEERPTMVT